MASEVTVIIRFEGPPPTEDEFIEAVAPIGGLLIEYEEESV